MNSKQLKNELGGIDIYLLDQLLKGRYLKTDKILDAGIGSGRNIHWFYENNYQLWAVDKSLAVIENIKVKYPKIADTIKVAPLEKLPFKDIYFNHIICNAVLHFASDAAHFKKMFSELVRVLKSNGTIFIRMASNIGIENSSTLLKDGVYQLPDKTTRFLLTKELLSELMKLHQLSFLEPIKTTNVNNLRCMTTLMLQKE